MNNDLQVRPSPAATVALRPMQAGDLPAMHRLVQAMSWPHRLEDCTQLFHLGAGTVAVDASGDMIGVGMRWGFGRKAGTIGMVLVAPDRQGRGIGRALMTALIADGQPRALMLNATAEGLGLYQKLGFHSLGQVRQHQARLTQDLVLSSAPAVPTQRANLTDHAALCALDAAAFGADRSALIGRLLTIGQAWITGSDRPTGFAILRPFGRGMMIGPILAPDEEAAVALVAAAAKAAPPGVLRVDIPAEASRLGHWLTGAGLPAVDTVTTMLLGKWPKTASEPRRFGLVLQALG